MGGSVINEIFACRTNGPGGFGCFSSGEQNNIDVVVSHRPLPYDRGEPCLGILADLSRKTQRSHDKMAVFQHVPARLPTDTAHETKNAFQLLFLL